MAKQRYEPLNGCLEIQRSEVVDRDAIILIMSRTRAFAVTASANASPSTQPLMSTQPPGPTRSHNHPVTLHSILAQLRALEDYTITLGQAISEGAYCMNRVSDSSQRNRADLSQVLRDADELIPRLL